MPVMTSEAARYLFFHIDICAGNENGGNRLADEEKEEIAGQKQQRHRMPIIVSSKKMARMGMNSPARPVSAILTLSRLKPAQRLPNGLAEQEKQQQHDQNLRGDRIQEFEKLPPISLPSSPAATRPRPRRQVRTRPPWR